MATDNNADDVSINIIQLGDETPLVIIFHRDADGVLSANIKGRMPQEELVDQLLFMAHCIMENGNEPLHYRVAPGYTACGESGTTGTMSTEIPFRVTCPACHMAMKAEL